MAKFSCGLFATLATTQNLTTQKKKHCAMLNSFTKVEDLAKFG
jgi:hypothetical protein